MAKRTIARVRPNRVMIKSAFALAALMLALANGPIKLLVINAAPAMVVNPSLEQTTNNVPYCFEQSGWGDHTFNWSLTGDAHSGAVAQSITLSNYVSGDRKLILTESADCAPTVIPGNQYDLSVWYKSTSANISFTLFRHSGAGWTYWTDLEQPGASANWKEVKVTTPVVPAGTDQISFGISLSGDGTLITDDYSFALNGATNPDPTPTEELNSNPDLELGGNPPTDWFFAGWGDAELDARVVNDAHSGTRAYAITLANRTQGDYKLLPTEGTAPAVQPGNIYNLSAWYKSTTADNSVTVFAHTASGWGYWTDIKTLPAAATWTEMIAQTPPIPAGVDAIAWGISIFGNGTLTTDDYSTKLDGEATPPINSGPAADGQWSVLNYEMPIRSVHSTLLKNGKVLLIAGSGNDVDAFNAGTFKASVWDPVSSTFIVLDVPKDMFCAGHVTLPDGRILIQGGTKSYPTSPTGADYGGIKDSWIFDPDTNTFTVTNDANEGHWYPTLTELGNGDIWMAGGLKEDTTGAVNTERFDTASGQWLPSWQVPQTWSFWGLYPHMFLMQDGRLFYSGGHVFGDGLPGTGASIYDIDGNTIADVPGLREKDMRDQSASVLLPPAQDQKVMITGGGNINTQSPAINLTDIIDLKAANPAYVPGPNLPGDGKMYVNATILPDRTVLLSNGGRLNRDDSTNVLTAAIYDPATDTMRSIPADPIGRNYHSSAILLPDGRVAVMGSNPGDGSFELRISVYEPKYMFSTNKPEIVNVPAIATYGQQITFDVDAKDKAIRWAQLIRPMSVTHQMDSNMRLVDLPINVVNGVATVSIPANSNLLPPGPYMLTVTNTDGIASTATWIMVN
jgi:hypothetical protein